MSYSIYNSQRPAHHVLYFKNAVPVTVVTATEEITVKLVCGDYDPDSGTWNYSNSDIAFQSSYTPGMDGLIYLDFDEIYKSYVKFNRPTSDIFAQANYTKAFRIIIANANGASPLQDIDFCVLNTAVKYNGSAIYWLAKNFLTNQPMEQHACKDAPLWLSFYDANGGLSLKARFYKKAGGNIDVSIATTNGAGCYTCNVSYYRLIRQIAALPSSLYGYYDVLLMDGDDIKAKQRYIYNERTGREQYYCFVNALGGIDTLICQGENVLQPDITYNIGRFGKSFRQLDDTDTIRAWSQNTGMLPWKWRNWLFEIFAQKDGCWKYADKVYTEIIISEGNLSVSNNGQLTSNTFGYILTENTSVIGSDERAAYAFRKSVADEAEEYESDMQAIELAFEDGATETIPVPAKVILVLATADAVVEATPISYLVDGTVVDDFTPSTTEPVQIALPAGDELSFETENVSVNGLILNYYPQTPS